MWEQRTIIFNQNNSAGSGGGCLSALVVVFFCLWITSVSLKFIFQALGPWPKIEAICNGLKTGWAAYLEPWHANSFNWLFGHYFMFFTMLFLLAMAIWILHLPLRLLGIGIPFPPIFITSLFLFFIPLFLWIGCGLVYWIWFMPPLPS